MIKNWIKTVVLLAALSGLLLFVGSLIGGKTGIQMAFVMALFMNGFAYFFSDKLVLKLYKAQKLDEQKYEWIYTIVRDLAHTMKIPMPKLWIVHNPMANAFATGRSPSHASIAVTSGILAILNEDELRGVLAHELSHVKNYDILVSTIAAILATAIGYIAYMIRFAMMWGGSDRRKNSNPIFMFFVALLMPVAATLLQLALSRSREYLADETGAHYSHDPLALASALKKLHNNIPNAHLQKDQIQYASTASLFILHPFSADGLINLFSTHPPMEKRVKRLETLYKNK